jgi:cytidylate kinase
VKSLYSVDVDHWQRFAIVADVSRLSLERIVRLLLAAGGVPVR